MKRTPPQKAQSLTMRSIFRYMMEEGYYPVYEHTHIQFDIDDSTAVIEYDEGILSVRLFFSIDEDAYDLFIEASNMTMMQTYAIKPVVLDDMKNLMFSCEIMCDTLKEFRKFLPRTIERLTKALYVHKEEMRKLIIANEVASATIPANEDSMTGIVKRNKMFS